MNDTYKLNTLNTMKIGTKAFVLKLLITGSMRRRLLDLGLIEGTQVECLQKSPSGDLQAYLIRGAVIALREEDSMQIIIN